jgi:RNA polymerase sigma-70 factor (ECF subfamily)
MRAPGPGGNGQSGPVDEVTLARAARGDAGAFRTLVRAYEAPVFALLGRILLRRGGQALVEDLAQETFVRVYRALPGFGADGRLNLTAWILTIAARLAIDELRRQPRALEPFDAVEHADEAARADDEAERRRIGRAIERAVDDLSPEYRAAFLLREVHGLEYDAIAESLGIDIGTVKSRLWRARNALRAALAGIYHE